MYPAITLTTFEAAPVSHRAEKPELTRLRRQYESIIRRQQEALLNLDNMLSPQDWLDAGDGFPGPGGWRVNRPAQRTQDRSNAPLSYLNEEEWRQHVALARDLCIRNHLALGFRDHVANFIGPVKISFVRRGSDPGASSAGLDGAPADALVQRCARAWEEWCEFAEWGQGEEDREEECRRRLIVEGETTLRFFVGDEASDGLPYARHIEPELIRTPSGHSTVDPQGWGVITAEGDDEREEGLWVCDPANVATGRMVDMRDYVRMKLNVDRTVKRGLSDFFPVADHLRKILGLLGNMAHVARLQAAIAWWEHYPSATLDQVAAQVRLGSDYSRPKLSGGNPTQNTDVTSHEAGTIFRVEGGREVMPGPVSQQNGFEVVERLVLRGIGFRWGCPSYFSGEGDASFASVLVTGSPFVRITESRQERLKAFACRVAARVLEFCERSGRLPRGTARAVKPVGTCKPVVIADEEKKARTFLSLYQQNCADPIEYMRSTGQDPKLVAANIAAWKAKFPDQGGAGGAPPPGAPPAPTDPTSTPPGSAGGDGSSPNPTDIFGEQILREKFTGDITDSVGRKRHYVNGKQVAQPQQDTGAGNDSAVPEQDRADITSSIDQAVAALPEADRPPAKVVERLKDVGLTVAAKTYLWALKVANSPKTAALGSLMADIFDTPSDLGKLGYNPNTSSGTANPRNADFVSANLADTIGVGVSGHLVASLASKLIVKAGAWAAGKMRGRAEAVETDGVSEWAGMIAQLLAHLHEQLGVQAPTPGAATVEKGLRAALTERQSGPAVESMLSEHIGVTADGDVWFSEEAVALLGEAWSSAGKTRVRVTDKNGNQVYRWVSKGTAAGADSQRTDAQAGEDNHVAARAIRDPASLTADDVKALAEFAGKLNAESLRQLNLAFRQKIGGTKAELANRLLDHVRGHIANRTVTTATPPAPRAAEVEFHGDSNKLFGGKLVELPDATVAAIGCAVDGAVVSVSVTRRMHGTDLDQPAATINTSGPGVRAIRFLYRDGRGKLVCYNEFFKFTKNVDTNTAGLSGIDLFVNQVRALRAAGVTKIKAFAGGDATDSGEMNGYYTWARFGYDGPIKKRVMKKLPSELARGMGKSNRLLKLFALPGGPEWWKQNGVSTSMTFDLRPDSPNLKALEAYATRRRQQDART